MTNPTVQALRDELAALRAHLQQVERQAQHDYEALAEAYRDVLQQQGGAFALRRPDRGTPYGGTPDPDCPF